jgi:osmoprotectant transport system ATP-binding protein
MSANSAQERSEPAVDRQGEILVDAVTKHFDDVTAVDDVSITIPGGEFFSMLGPSGCGKTTTLRMIAGFEAPDAGRILLQGSDVTNVPPAKRNVNMVFQAYGLFPHMTVAENIGTVPRLLGWDRARTRTRTAELLELVGLEPEYGKRYPAQLSGGQRQRVGLARALAANPPLMLMDEPFGAIDPIVRARLQDEFLRLQRELRKTVLFVTHDIDEAIYMSDRIVIMTPRPGRIERILEIDLPRPRQRNGPEFLKLRGDILEMLHFAGNVTREPQQV